MVIVTKLIQPLLHGNFKIIRWRLYCRVVGVDGMGTFECLILLISISQSHQGFYCLLDLIEK